MKIVCQSCQAKYTIADEKVVGKVVKIRCKKCGSTIVVNGQDDSSREERTEIRSSPLGSAGSDAPADEWVVNYADNDQRNMTTGQIIAEFSTGALSDETYCWRDGMDDWLPLREIGELAAACGLTVVSSVQQQQPLAAREPEPYDPAPAAAPMESYPGSPAAGPGGNALSSIFGSQPAPAPTPGYAAPAAQPDSGAAAARRAGGRGGGADLFGAAATAGSESDVMTSAPQHPTATADGKLTGQRNENSVLFSLATLTAGSAKKGPDAGAVNEDGSGLIDIRALSTSMGTAGGPHKASHADDIMNLGGGGAFSAPLAAPVLTAALADSGDPNAPAAAANNTKLYAMFGGLAALLIVGMVGMFFALRPPATPLALNAPAGSGVAAPGGSAPAASAPSVAASAPAPSADPAASVAAADPGVKATAPAVGTQKRSTGAGAGAGAAAAIPPAAAPAAPAPFVPPAPAGLEGAIAGSVKNLPPPPAPAAATGGSAPFDRGAAAASLGGIADSVGSCKKPGGPTGEGHAQITFAPSGTVVSAIVDQPPYAGTAVGGCVAGKFRSAHVPPFAGGNMSVGKRFTIN